MKTINIINEITINMKHYFLSYLGNTYLCIKSFHKKRIIVLINTLCPFGENIRKCSVLYIYIYPVNLADIFAVILLSFSQKEPVLDPTHEIHCPKV